MLGKLQVRIIAGLLPPTDQSLIVRQSRFVAVSTHDDPSRFLIDSKATAPTTGTCEDVVKALQSRLQSLVAEHAPPPISLDAHEARVLALVLTKVLDRESDLASTDTATTIDNILVKLQRTRRE